MFCGWITAVGRFARTSIRSLSACSLTRFFCLPCSGLGDYLGLRWTFLFVGVAFTLFAHTMIETPGMQYTMWAHNESSDPQDSGSHNLLEIRSSALGMLAVVIAMSLNVLLVPNCVSMLVDWLRLRKSKPPAAVAP
jgi:hypothetical protein